ncbi:MAG: M28 family peptidase [Bacteroidales bacterium]|nr:M28 family peptidase [Bacteroidales bacterium]
MKSYTFFILILLLSAAGCNSPEENPGITVNELRDHVTYLASDELGGRYPGTRGAEKAAGYIRDRFEEAGLRLFEDSGYQNFSVTMGQEPGSNNTLSMKEQRLRMGEDFTPLPFSGNGKHSGEVVFAGYGLQTKARGFTWDDYSRNNVNGRWVMILRGAPDKDQLKRYFMGKTRDREKALTAKDQGAAGILFVSGFHYDSTDRLVNPRLKKGNIEIPALHITRDAANKILVDRTIRELEEKITRRGQPHTFKLKTEITASCDLETKKATARNVIGLLKSTAEQAPDRYIVVGGHYDHLGMGGEGTGSRRPDTTAIHNGADDNASGIAAMMEIAEKMAEKRDSLQSHFIFVAFDTEEMGLLGSRYFMSHPPVNKQSMEAMINLDMIGRLRDANSLQVGGIGTATESEKIIHRLNDTSDFQLGLTREGYGPSDHSSFYSQDIPVFFFSTGPHLDYHTPADDAEKLNYRGLQKVSDLVYRLALQLANLDSGLTFRQAGPKMKEQQARHGEEMQVTLGIMPDFAGVVKKGLRADLVIEDKPADRAGMENGDIITAIEGKKISDIYDYMDRMSEFRPGETITLEILRDEKQKVLMVQL